MEGMLTTNINILFSTAPVVGPRTDQVFKVISSKVISSKVKVTETVSSGSMPIYCSPSTVNCYL